MNPEQLKLFADIEDKHWWFSARRQILKKIAHRLLPKQGSRVLDIGCGTGGNLSILAPNYRCTGLDGSRAAIAHARQRFPHVTFMEGSVTELVPEIAAKSDLVMMMDVIEHVADDFEFVSRVLYPMRPGANLLMTVPADMQLWSPHDETVLHYRRYDRERFEATWADLPVRLRLISHFNTRLYFLVKALRWRNRGQQRASGVAGTDFQMPPPWINRVLQRIFAGEGTLIAKGLDTPNVRTYKRGVSLIAVIQRKAGALEVRTKPNKFATDPFVPPMAENFVG